MLSPYDCRPVYLNFHQLLTPAEMAGSISEPYAMEAGTARNLRKSICLQSLRRRIGPVTDPL